MPTVDLQRPLTVPAVPARSAASAIVHDIADERNEWCDFALYLNFGAVGLPDVGYIAIPVVLSGIAEATEPRHEIRFKIRARRGAEAFPTFDGAIGIDATGPSSAVLWLAGTYEVPLHGFGGLLNQTLARGTAEKALENMLSELADGIVARVEKREMATARYRLIFNTGD